MRKYDKVKYYFENGLWSVNRVKDAVLKDWITKEEFEEITEQSFEEDWA